MRAAPAGAIAAAGWALSEPVLRRLLGTDYSDVRLLGRAITRGRAWPLAGLTAHMVNGAVFGAVFSGLGLRGVKQAVLAAELENAVLWPGMLVVDRLHPDRRDGTWPPLFANRRVVVYEVTTHALFGTLLGLLSRGE